MPGQKVEVFMSTYHKTSQWFSNLGKMPGQVVFTDAHSPHYSSCFDDISFVLFGLLTNGSSNKCLCIYAEPFSFVQL